MRVKEDLRRCVLFLGYRADSAHDIHVIGTGFQINYGGLAYLVTAGHVAKGLGSDPFVVRVNETSTRLGVNIDIDDANWYFHPDYPSVDLAVISGTPKHSHNPDAFEVVGLDEEFILSDDEFSKRELGPGDRVHIVGLFRLLHGKKRNLPVVHTGWIAMMPGDEPIPVREDRDGKTQTINVNGYLVEAQTLDGLSGSPVFVEQTWRVKFSNNQVAKLDTNTSLLGVWQAAWDAPPDEVRSAQMPQTEQVLVPVGMGIVVPATRIIELLETTEVAEHRKEVIERRDGHLAATQQRAAKPAPPTTDDNPQHQEDFNRLLGEATRTPTPDDQT